VYGWTMSLLETPMTRRYWERVKGTLLEEYRIGQRRIDAVIIEDSDHRIASQAESVSLTLDGHDIIIVQTKLHLGMSLLGQAFFSRELIKDRFAPRSVRAVALCAMDDADDLRPIAKRFGIEIVVDIPPIMSGLHPIASGSAGRDQAVVPQQQKGRG
jgi:hypothetical protein